MLDAQGLIEKHKSKSVIIDANLLVLLVVGRVNRKRIIDFKRTQSFTIADFDLLEGLIRWFGAPIISTPHILSQVSDLTDLKGAEGPAARRLLRDMIDAIDERYGAAKNLTGHFCFEPFGLGDAAIASVSERRALVVTVDLQLHFALQAKGLECINFNHIRQFGPRR